MPRTPKAAAPSKAPAAPKISPVLQALQLFEAKMTESGNEIAAILSDLTIDFDNLTTQLAALGVGEVEAASQSPASAGTKPRSGKAPVVEDDVEDDEDEDEVDLDDEDEDYVDADAELDEDEDDEDEEDDDEDDEDDVEAELDEADDDDDDDDDWSAPPARPQTAARPKAQAPAAAPQRKKRPGTRR